MTGNGTDEPEATRVREEQERPEQEHERWEGYTDRELKRLEFERKLAEARRQAR